ncbi:transporter substrate-binding domain-containing protein [Labrys wisconsinensis]|uniref:Polar amino acid transport system substrate-binding protein n=1 Tax=Labrys wisconsinensis TaxID=425677 RepID=A0ABU0JAS8_9HYPH|nr:transporter substrate-binding domain-containing protein [Labrys wisconsinensis]MDQ0471369.1 polar amino acid transport system substrate-binding protein [Labrys wisconsinensis]
MFRRAFLGLALAVATLAAVPAPAAGLPDLKGRRIVAVTENAYYPLNFTDPKTGKGIGWEYDAVNEIARRLNATVEWQTTAWDSMIQAVQGGQFDIGMDGISITDERRKQIDYSDPYMVSEQFMLVRGNEKRFADAKSFGADAKLLVGAQSGTTNFYVAVSDLLGGNDKSPRLKLFETFGASLQALKVGDVDTVLMDMAGAQGNMDAAPGVFKIVGKGLGHDEFGFIFKKGSDLVAPVNAALAAMKADGTLARLEKKWFYDYKITN